MRTDQTEPSIILASESPRRRALLTQAGICLEVIPSHIDEGAVAVTSPQSYVGRLAEAKAAAVSKIHPSRWVIGADTVVYLDNTILEKPKTTGEAHTMLERLGGTTHQVFTGFCICCRSRRRSHTEVAITDVTFKPLTEDEIQWYIQTREPYDKAGGYAIQGLGAFLVKRINGSYTNVVGLPVCEVMDYLTKEKILTRTRGTELTIDD